MIDGECLAAFVAIAEERSFSRAADSLGIVQSVISKRLARLEDVLGAELVDRRRKNDIRLTRVGHMFLDEANQTLAQLSKAQRIGRNLARGKSGPVNIGYIFSAAMSGSLTALLSNLRAGAPELALRPRLMETPVQLAELESGKLDMGLMRPRPSYPESCRAVRVHSEPLVLCLAALHPLCSNTEIDPRSLSDEQFILPQFHETVGLIDSLNDLSRCGGFQIHQLTRTDDFVTAAALAAAGDGIVLAPASLKNLGMSGIAFRHLNGYHGSIDTVLVSRKDAPFSEIFLSGSY